MPLLMSILKVRVYPGKINQKKDQGQLPSYNSDKPVSRQFEDAYYGYYGWPSDRDGDDMSGEISIYYA